MNKEHNLPKLLFLGFLLFSCTTSIAQDCAQSTAQTDLDINNVRARLQVGGDLWWDGSDGRYIVPKPAAGESEVAAIFAGGLWIGGFDPGGNLNLAAQTYGRSSGSSDYWPGVLDQDGNTSEDNCANFDRFWSTNSADINNHIADLNDNGTIDGPVPSSILAWPGLGNPDFFSQNGFELPFPHPGGLAPFVDQDANGVYEPMNGDYPFIKEADQGTWWVFNDAGNIHTQSFGLPARFEVQALAYSYSSANPNINNATFYDYKFINKELEPLDSAYVGLWVDFDLGCYQDDYIGCYSSENIGYVYNRDAVDGISDCNDCAGVNTYCEDIPIVGVKILEGAKAFVNNEIIDRGMSSFAYYNNGGINPPPPPGTTDPNSPSQIYNLLTGTWPDGTPYTVGGSGYNPGSTDFTNYAFDGDPSEANDWSMCSEGFADNDPRVVIGSGPFTSQPGSINTLSFAVIYVDDIQYPCPSINPLIEAGNDVQDLYDNGIMTSTEELATIPANIIIQPNPMTDQADLIFNDLENQVENISIFSIDGKELQNHSNINGASFNIKRGNMSPGIYFYKVLTKDFKIHSGKLIVQ